MGGTRRWQPQEFHFSNRHHDLMARDEEHILGWRYEPRIMFESGRGIVLVDVDGNEYFDMTAGMMCMVLGHSHPELTETIREQAGKLVHESSWYSNPPLVELAELIASTMPGDLKKVNFAVTGSEANEIAMRLALGVTGKYDIVSLIRGLHGGQPRRGGGDERRRRPQGAPRPPHDAGPPQRDLRPVLLPLPHQPRVPVLRRRLPRAGARS